MKRGSKYSFQRIYPYTCKGCKEKRYTRFFNRREDEICTLCRRKEVNKNQLQMPFGVDEKGMILTIDQEGNTRPLDNDTRLNHN